MAAQASTLAGRYTVEAFDLFGGRHCATASLAKYLAYFHRPFSEAMLFGLGGGVGFASNDAGGRGLLLNTRFVGTRPLEFENGILSRIGADAEVLEFEDQEEGHAALLLQLELGEPAIVYGDMGELPYFGHPPDVHFGGHVFLVYAVEGDEAFISDCCQGPVRVPLERLRAARFAKCAAMPPRGRMLKLNLPLRPPSPAISIREGVGACCRSMLDGHPAEGLSGLYRWPHTVAAWVEMDAGIVFRRLRAVHDNIEIAGTGGGAFRLLYSAFLGEAGDELRDERLREACRRYRVSADHWRRVAEAALPPCDPLLIRVRELTNQRARLYATQPAHGRERMLDIASEIDQLGRQWAATAHVSHIAKVVAGLQQAALRCAVMEDAAIHALCGCAA